MNLTIYHNPRCSKSRQTLNLIREKGIEPEIVLYLETPPTAAELEILMKRLGVSHPKEFIRKGEALYKSLELKMVEDPVVLIQTMAENPKLIERPIVDNGKLAILGRPPENVLDLL